MTVEDVLVKLMQERSGVTRLTSLDGWRDVLASLVRAEREACAKVADDRAAVCRDAQKLPESSLPSVEIHTALEAEHIAMLIRKRSNGH